MPEELDPAAPADDVLTGVPAAPPQEVLEEEPEELEPEVEVSPDLVFTSTVKDRKGSQVGEELPFKVDGQVYTAIRPPESAFIFVTTAAARSTPTHEKMKSIIEFLGEALTEESGTRLRDRLLDPADDFEFDDLLPILQKIVRHWSKDNAPRSARDRKRGRR